MLCDETLLTRAAAAAASVGVSHYGVVVALGLSFDNMIMRCVISRDNYITCGEARNGLGNVTCGVGAF